MSLPSPPSPRERIVFIDAARGILMLAGVFLHAAIFYSSHDRHWLLQEGGGGPIFDVIFHGLHFFRMPAFFLLSGYFSAMMLSKYGPIGFYRRRLIRTLLPLVSTALTFNLAQDYLLAMHTGASGSLSEWLHGDQLQEFFLKGRWVGHLWFLIVLVIYFLLIPLVAVSPAAPLIRMLSNWISKLVESCRHVGPAVVVMMMPLLLVFHVSVGHYVREFFYSGVLSPYKIVMYSHYFIFGMLCFRVPALFAAFTTLRLPGILIVGAVATMLYLSESGALPEFITKFKHNYTEDLFVWLALWPLMAFFRLALNQQSAAWTYLSGAALSIYLFHHLFVLLAGIALMPYDWPKELKFLIVVLFASSIALAIHHFVVRRFELVQLLFNGFRRQK